MASWTEQMGGAPGAGSMAGMASTAAAEDIEDIEQRMWYHGWRNGCELQLRMDTKLSMLNRLTIMRLKK